MVIYCEWNVEDTLHVWNKSFSIWVIWKHFYSSSNCIKRTSFNIKMSYTWTRLVIFNLKYFINRCVYIHTQAVILIDWIKHFEVVYTQCKSLIKGMGGSRDIQRNWVANQSGCWFWVKIIPECIKCQQNFEKDARCKHTL